MVYQSGFIATPSKIRNFLECPRKYFFQHVNLETKYKYPERSYFTLGHHVHNALRDFFALDPFDRSPEKLFNLLEENWQTHTGRTAGFKDEEDEAQNKQRAIAMLHKFLATENWKVKPLYLPEKGGSFPGFQSASIEPGLSFGGIVDRIDEDPDGSLHIIDYKTSKYDEPDLWQLPIYAVLVSRLHGRMVGHTSYILLEHEKRYTEIVTIEGNFGTIKRVKEVIDKIPKSRFPGDFTCRLGDNCHHCDYLLELGLDPKTGGKLGQESKDRIDLFTQNQSNDLPF